MKTYEKNKGFTLAEMLIVVAIIGVLIAIVSTAISNTIEKAKEAKDMANIRTALDEMNSMILTDSTIELPFYKESADGSIRVFVKCTSEKPNWQMKNDASKISIGVDKKCSAPNEAAPYIRIKYDPSSGEYSFAATTLSNKHKNHVYNK